MKGKIIYLLALILVGAIACQKKVDIAAEEKVDIAAEEEAIKTVIKNQLVAFKNLDYEGEAATWAHEPYILRVSGESLIVGWDSLSTWYKTNFRELREKGPEYFTMREFGASNFDIHLKGNVAFVLFDEYSDYTFEGKEYSDVSRVVKYFEKKEGEWKMVATFPHR